MPNTPNRQAQAAFNNPALPIVIYLGIVGVVTLLGGGEAPQSVESTTPHWLAASWALSLTFGGALATGACLTHRHRAEDAGLATLVFGLLLFTVAEIARSTSISLTTASALTALSACCLIRMRVLHLARRAQRTAELIVEG